MKRRKPDQQAEQERLSRRMKNTIEEGSSSPDEREMTEPERDSSSQEASEKSQSSQDTGSNAETDDEGDDEDDGRTLEDKVSDIPFVSLEQVKRDGRGLTGVAARKAAHAVAKKVFSRSSKDHPQEVSSKRPVARFREVIQVPNRVGRDPRFSTGPTSDKEKDAFRKRYSFLFNDTLPGEQQALRDKLKREKNPKFKAALQAQLTRVESALSQEELRRRKDALQAEYKSKERTAVAAGKSPFYMKKSDQKKLELLAKYQLLQEKGKLDKYMAKRARKNASKDHRYLPSARRPAAGPSG